MCGIFGGISKDLSKINMDKINTLGIMNETRGIHSCGISIDGEILKGLNAEAKYRSFASTIGGMVPSTDGVVIGHTRHATVGVHTTDNCHPFGFKKDANEDSLGFIGVHNGSLKGDYAKLATKRGIAASRKSFVASSSANVNKIDSELLLETIYRCGYEILNEYYGAAALVWYNPAKPSEVFFYHGKSKSFNSTHSTSGGEEERPLFWYKAEDNLFYYSSIKESLQVINNTDGKIEAFDHNVVYKVTDGDIENAEMVFTSDREFKRSQVAPPTTYENTRSNNSSNISSSSKLYMNQELLPIKTPTDKSQYVFRRLRVYRNGHLANGIFYNVEGYGLLLLTTGSMTDAKNRINDCINNNMLLSTDLGNLITRKQGVKLNGRFIELPFGSKQYDSSSPAAPSELWLVQEGVPMKTTIDYNRCKALDITSQFSAKAVSEMSRFPYTHIGGTKNTETIYSNGGIATIYNFKNPLSDKIYDIQYGTLKKSTFLMGNQKGSENNLRKITETASKELEKKDNSLQKALDFEVSSLGDIESFELDLQISLLEAFESLTTVIGTLGNEVSSDNKSVKNLDLKKAVLGLLEESSESIAAAFNEIDTVKSSHKMRT